MKTIRQLREEHGLSQEQVAAQLRCTQHAISSWERGRTEPKARQVRALAQLFSVSMDDIAFEAEAARGTSSNEQRELTSEPSDVTVTAPRGGNKAIRLEEGRNRRRSARRAKEASPGMCQ